MPTPTWVDYEPGEMPRCPAWGTRLYASPDRRKERRTGGADRRRFPRAPDAAIEEQPPCGHKLQRLGAELPVRVRVHPDAVKADGTIDTTVRGQPTLPRSYTTVCERCRASLEVEICASPGRVA